MFTSLLGAALFMTTSSASIASGATQTDAPPAGIVPTTTTLGQVLRAHDAAVGTLASTGRQVRVEEWQFTKAGQQGTEHLVRSGTDYHSVIKSGPFTEEYGQVNSARWHMDENGVVSDTTDVETNSFEMFRVLEDASDPKNDVNLLGETQLPQPAYVVEVREAGSKHPEWIFFDKQTSLIVRTEQVISRHRFVSTYDGYQTVRGLTEPAHIHDSDGTTYLDDDYRRQSLNFAASAKADEFGKPPARISYMMIDHPVNLHARVLDNTVVVRLTVDGRGLDFELSSGDADSYIDWDVARELNLPAFGQLAQAQGTSIPYETELADATVGDIRLQHFALEALPFHYHANASTKVVGTLGYDFLSQGFFTVDYVNGSVIGNPINDVPANDADSYLIPVWIDDGKPFFTTFIGSHESDDVLLDSSFDLSFVLGSFSQQYPEAVVDVEGGKNHGHAVVPFADSGSYGRDVDVWIANVPSFAVGPLTFVNYKMLATNLDMEQGDHAIDAVIGAQFLQYFDVSYDLTHNRIYLKPNAFFRKSFKSSS
jgi:hypothetical protein